MNPNASPARLKATVIGFTAILMWALLAALTAASGRVPPFQLAALCFAIGSLIGLLYRALRPGPRISPAALPAKAWALGVGGLFGYHFFYFTALRNAPAVEAGLIAYLWPLLIVLFSALLPGERLRWTHMAGALLAFAGAGLIVTRGAGLDIDPHFAAGYLAALACAFIWSGYSVLSRRFAAIPSAAVTYFCAASALLSALCHVALETTVWPHDAVQWLAVVGLGLGPVGLAFYTWDHGVKRGDIQLLGVSAYAAPLLSTLLLIAFGYAPLTWAVVAAAVLVTAGAALAAMPARRPTR